MQPLYQIILNDLQKQILAGTLPPKSQVPTEKELSATYNVSRITSKRALTELEQAGLIERIRGKGSFVKDIQPTKAPKKRLLFLLPFYNDLSLGNFSAGLQPVLQARGYEVMMTNFDFLHNHHVKEITDEFDGLIYYTPYDEEHLELLFNLSLAQFPIVVLDKEITDLDLPSMMSDNLAGGELATNHLLQLGHTKIGYLFNSANHVQSTRQRYLGYLQAMSEQHLPVHTALSDPLATIENLTAYIEQTGLTALVCENDLVAIEAMRRLKEAGHPVPQTVSVVGFDDIQAASLVTPALTTISQDFKKIGELAGTHLINWVETGLRPTSVKVPIKLTRRQSTKEQKK